MAASMPKNWNDFAAVSPQGILERLSKGVEKGLSWLDGPVGGQKPTRKPKEASQARRRSTPTPSSAMDVQAESTSEPTPEPEPQSPKPETEAAVSRCAVEGHAAPTSPGGNGAAGQEVSRPSVSQVESRPKSRAYGGELSRIEAEAMLQRLNTSSGNLDEVRRLRKLLDDRSFT